GKRSTPASLAMGEVAPSALVEEETCAGAGAPLASAASGSDPPRAVAINSRSRSFGTSAGQNLSEAFGILTAFSEAATVKVVLAVIPGRSFSSGLATLITTL